MLLIVSNSEDATADLVEQELQRRGAEFFRLNTDMFPREVAGSAIYDAGECHLELRSSNRSRVIRGSDVTSVWYRRPVPPKISADIADAGMRRFSRDEAYEFLRGFWLSLDCYWMSHPEVIRVAERKLVQLGLASRMGFRVPRTVVTNDPTRVMELRERCPGGLIVKPLYVGFVEGESEPLYVYTTRLDDVDYERIGSVALTPSIYQQAIDRVADIRVTVVGERVFAARIEAPEGESGLTDWRCYSLADLRHSEDDLPDNIRDGCLALVRNLRLEFGAIDFVVDSSGNYVFLEINANGQWGWLEKVLGMPITGALVDRLVQH